MSKVLITGGSGFVAEHIILRLLAAGYQVRSTLRNLDRESQVRARLARAGSEHLDRLSFVPADLTKDDGWADATGGCDKVFHVASPFPPGASKSPDEIIRPAVDGTLRVLRAARNAGVKRVVMTSSFAAIGYGHPPSRTNFDETDWTDVNAPGLAPYIKSKALAERAAWDFIGKEGGALELTVVNPVGIFGPVLDDELSSSILIVKRMLEGSMPGCPRVYFGVVDVRDVADLHLLAMSDPHAAGERFLAVAGDCISMFDVARILKRRLSGATKVPHRQISDWQMRIAALWNAEARQTLTNLGRVRNSSNAKARRVLGWKPRSTEEAIVATGESLLPLLTVARRTEHE